MIAVQYPIAFCPVHGVFAAKVVALEAGASVELINVATNCPTCGRDSEIIPGRYSATAKRLNIVLDPSISLDALRALRGVLAEVEAGKKTLAEASSAADKIHPGAGGLFNFTNWSPEVKAGLIVSVATIIGAMIMARATPENTVNIRPVIERVLSKSELRSTTSLRGVPLPHVRPAPKPPKR